MATTRVGFVGLGIMGGPMAANLVKAGFDVVGYNRSRGKVERLVGAGGRGAASAAEAARDRDVVISMLPDSPDVEEFALGDGGALALARPGSLYIDMSTVRPATAVALAEAATGGGSACSTPRSAVASGGRSRALCRSWSAAIRNTSPRPTRAGGDGVHGRARRGAGAGQTVKAANQLLTAVTIQAVAEAVVFLEAHGVDPTVAIGALRAASPAVPYSTGGRHRWCSGISPRLPLHAAPQGPRNTHLGRPRGRGDHPVRCGRCAADGGARRPGPRRSRQHGVAAAGGGALGASGR